MSFAHWILVGFATIGVVCTLSVIPIFCALILNRRFEIRLRKDEEITLADVQELESWFRQGGNK